MKNVTWLFAFFILLVDSVSGLSFIGIGDLPGDSFDSKINGISGDGRIAVGTSRVSGIRTYSSEFEAFYWSQTSGIVGIGDLDSERIGSIAFAANFNGSVIVGKGDTINGYSGTIWAKPDLNPASLNGTGVYQMAKDVSSDGSVVVGYTKLSTMSFAPFSAFRWTSEGGLQGLGSLPGGSSSSEAEAISGDGNVVVGYSGSSNGPEAFIWTQSEGMIGIGDLPGGDFDSRANDVNTDGSVVVGKATTNNGSEAFVWNQDSGMLGLGFRNAMAVSGDGNTVVGYSDDGAVIWDPINGVRLLEDILYLNGIDVSGWTLVSATDISEDGSVVVGYGKNSNGDTEGFVISGMPVIEPLAPVLNVDTFYESNNGESITIDATPTDGSPTNYTYKWYLNNSPISPDSSSLTLTGSSFDDGTWKVEVTNDTGTTSTEFEYRVFSDADNDGLSDYREANILGTDPNNNDSDGDALLDGVETNTGIWVSASDTGTDPLSNDTDADGLLDGVETNTGEYVDASDTGTDPLNSDTDSDGLIDGSETNTNVYVSSSDTGSDPLDNDSDSDGILDGYETATGSWLSSEDTGTNPTKADSDADGLSDGAETNSGVFVGLSDTGTDPNSQDSDGDGFTDKFEVDTSNDPTSITDTPDAFTFIETAVEVNFYGAIGGTYRIEHTEDLESDSWVTVEDGIEGSSELIERLYSTDDFSRRFFRVIRTDQ